MKISSNIFILNLKKWMLMLTPTFLRGDNIRAFFDWIVTPFNHCLNSLLTRRNADLFRLNHSCQVCSMRAMLAEFLGAEYHQITITDNAEDIQIVLYSTVEETAVMITNNANLFTGAEVNSSANFVVRVPAVFMVKENEIKAMIEIYKLVGKTYKIQYYE